MSDKPKNDRSYHAAAHAMQAGVAMMLEVDPKSANPKHVRTGINSAMVNDHALAKLLIAKGVFTQEEYVEAVRVAMNEEVDMYEKQLSEHFQRNIKLY